MMSDIAVTPEREADLPSAPSTPGDSYYQSDAFAARLAARHRSERRFRRAGIVAIGLAGLVLVVLLGSVIFHGVTGFFQSNLKAEVYFDPAVIDPDGQRDPAVLAGANYQKLVRESVFALFPEIQGRDERRALMDLVSSGNSFRLRDQILANPALIGTRQPVSLLAADNVDQLLKGNISRDVVEAKRNLSDQQIGWIDRLLKHGVLTTDFSLDVIFANNSRQPELAGMRGAIIGSFLTLLITILMAVPIGVSAAVYLEEFAPKNSWTDLIEVNINNLAAVPSIVFGLLGLSVFLNFFGLPRSAPLVGGLVLALMTLPIVIIAARSALKAVPPSIREAALGIGASPVQVVSHHVLPLAMPGILTGTIIGMAHALGETAPLLMIGMVAFVADAPGAVTDPATVLPVQIYMWAESAERGWVERTSAAIMILLAFLISMNALAVWLRRKFERRW